MTVPILIVNNASEFDGLGTDLCHGYVAGHPANLFTPLFSLASDHNRNDCGRR